MNSYLSFLCNSYNYKHIHPQHAHKHINTHTTHSHNNSLEALPNKILNFYLKTYTQINFKCAKLKANKKHNVKRNLKY